MRPGPQPASEANAPDGDASAGDARGRILVVADRALLARAICSVIEKSLPGNFELAVESRIERAALRIEGERFDLLLVDLALEGTRRPVLMDRASELATRLPVVALSGTEGLDRAEGGGAFASLSDPHEEAELALVLHRTLRRARRLGTFALAPVFCRLERFGA